MIIFAILSVPTTPFGIFLRFVAIGLERKHFAYVSGDGIEIQSLYEKFSLVCWNICAVGGGYSITDGGVVPWVFRVEEIGDMILSQNADVVCLYEVFDIHAALSLYKKFSPFYAHFYFNIGSKTVGISSGVLVASKYRIASPVFEMFPEEHLVGRTKNIGKGIFSFDLVASNMEFARIYCLHLQHSEQCEFPSAEEVDARLHQMNMVIDHVRTQKDKAIIVNGDLNLDENEFENSTWKNTFVKDSAFSDKTWGGDMFCANLVGKKISRPLDYDYILLVRDTAKVIRTELVPVSYHAEKYTPRALSDHSLLRSVIHLK